MADEPDPARLSELVEQLISELDALKEELDAQPTRVSTGGQEVS